MPHRKQVELGHEYFERSPNGDMSAKIVFNVKTWIAIMAIAWAPACTIGVSMLKWGSAMDTRVTIQEQTNQNIAKTLAKIEVVIDQDLRSVRESTTELKATVKILERDLTEVKNQLTTLEGKK